MAWLRRLVVLVPALVLALVLGLVDVGVFAMHPGKPESVIPRIELEGVRTYPPDGSLLLTTVNLPRATVYGVIEAWLDPAVRLVPEEEIIPPEQTEEEYEEETRSQMDESKIAAVAFAARRLTGYPQEHAPGALVQDVVDGAPASGKLFPGDLIVEADDEPIEDVEELSGLIRSTGGERAMALTVDTDGEERVIRVRPEIPEGESRPILGVILVNNFPFDVTIDSGSIGGPSAGLMWALGAFELLSEEDLIRGRKIAGTGQIDLDGRVYPIGGVEQKVRAAEEAGATIFLVPEGNLEGARSVDPDLRLIPVATIAEAISALRTGGG